MLFRSAINNPPGFAPYRPHRRSEETKRKSIAAAKEQKRKSMAAAKEQKRAEEAFRSLHSLTVGEVEALFENIEKPSSLVSYSVAFKEKAVDGDMLSRVDSEDVILSSLPLTNVLHARQLLDCITQWKKEGVPKVKLVNVSPPRMATAPPAQSASSSPSSRSVLPPPPPSDPLVFSSNYTIDGACFDSGATRRSSRPLATRTA